MANAEEKVNKVLQIIVKAKTPATNIEKVIKRNLFAVITTMQF